MSGRCRKNVKQNAVDDVEKSVEKLSKPDRHKIEQKSARNSNRVVDKLVNEQHCNARRKRGRENFECEKKEEEEELNTAMKKKGKGRNNTRENVVTDKDDLQEIAASNDEKILNTATKNEIALLPEEEELNTGTKKKKRGKNIREKVESEKQKQEKTLSESHRRDKCRKGNEIASNMFHQCQRNDKGRVVRCISCKTKLLPFLRRFNTEQVMEMEIEAKIQGVPVSELMLPKAKCRRSEHIHWLKLTSTNFLWDTWKVGLIVLVDPRFCS
ncbi:ABC transporter F family member 4-like isoform X2 [Solanum pennellii]|uniref:ABC transporter F family member 4-like isoform X2 n=1 Tax=Solanum pennellii TaxID=28526 RepID=A0ABM1HGJ2_SOLPN|nr:ABC transporter F family member 4-like isoform X2 [Solanum pennellii]